MKLRDFLVDGSTPSHINFGSNFMGMVGIDKNGDLIIMESDPIVGYKISEEDTVTSQTYKYYGYLNAAGGWYIWRITTNGDNTKSHKFCKGDSDFSTAWTNRATQTYDNLAVIF